MCFQSRPPSVGSIHSLSNDLEMNPHSKNHPIQASRSKRKMCRGIHYIHAGCNHSKKFNAVEPCNNYNGISCSNLIPIHVLRITSPALCVVCYRQKESAIDAEYETTARDLQNEIARVDECFAKGWVRNEISAQFLDDYRDECEDNILQAKASRDTSIRLFRQEQGVWGDG